jgi:hypothetical protein
MARRGQWVILIPVALYVGFLLFWGAGAVARRYFLPAMPYLVYAFLAGVASIASWWRRRPPDAAVPGRPVGRTAVIVAGILCIAISVPKIAREVYWARSPDFYLAYENGKWNDVIETARYLRREGRPKVDTLMGPQSTVLHYLTGLRMETALLAPGYVPWDPASGPPRVFAEAAARGPARFVVVPTVPQEWSREALAAMEAGGAFDPPVTFGRLAVFKRREGTSPEQPLSIPKETRP